MLVAHHSPYRLRRSPSVIVFAPVHRNRIVTVPGMCKRGKATSPKRLIYSGRWGACGLHDKISHNRQRAAKLRRPIKDTDPDQRQGRLLQCRSMVSCLGRLRRGSSQLGRASVSRSASAFTRDTSISAQKFREPRQQLKAAERMRSTKTRFTARLCSRRFRSIRFNEGRAGGPGRYPFPLIASFMPDQLTCLTASAEHPFRSPPGNRWLPHPGATLPRTRSARTREQS